MPFIEMKFKGNTVFVEVDDNGALLSEKGRARMKYRLDDDRTYNPNVSNLISIDGRAPLFTAAKNIVPKKTSSGPASRKPFVEKSPAASAVIAYTDGACSGNPGPAGLGYVMRFPDGRTIRRGEPLGTSTNNIAELTAILRVLQSLDDTDQEVVIHTDSSYALGLLTKGWKAKANTTLVEEIRRVLRQFPRASFVKVKGHAGVPDNELVDTLARKAAETQTIVE